MLELLSAGRFLAGSRATLEANIYVSGTATTPATAGTVTVKDAHGTTLSSGAATISGSTLRYTPTAASMANVNQLTLTWADVVIGTDPAISVTTSAEAVGELLFTEAEARAFDGGALSDATLYPDAMIRRAHDLIMDAFEGVLGYPLGRRYYVETLDSEGGTLLRLSRPYVRTVRKIEERLTGSRTYQAYTQDQLDAVFANNWGLLQNERSTFQSGLQAVRVGYEAGKPIHAEIRRAGLFTVRHQLVRSNIPARALFQNTDQGQFRIAVAGDNEHWFGLPDVDAVLARHREPVAW